MGPDLWIYTLTVEDVAGTDWGPAEARIDELANSSSNIRVVNSWIEAIEFAQEDSPTAYGTNPENLPALNELNSDRPNTVCVVLRADLDRLRGWLESHPVGDFVSGYAAEGSFLKFGTCAVLRASVDLRYCEPPLDAEYATLNRLVESGVLKDVTGVDSNISF